MLLFNYFDGATGPVQPVGRTNYTEGYVRAEFRAQAERKQVVQDAAEGEAWLATDWHVRERGSELRALRRANWQRLCDEMRKAVEGKK